ncbi:MAG: prolyl oligopeptidase family serine peptidase [Chitinophagaceae bacterium]|nr:prolyl oligopeptidase family serine peptidase [Chitinophagaceae bacterium]
MNLFKIKPTTLFLLIFCITGVSLTHAQISRFSFNKFINKGDTLNYRQLFPDADPLRKYPLIIFLHGSGERGNDNEAQLKWGVMNFADDQAMRMYPAFVIAPQCPANMEWANFTNNKNSLEMRLQPSPSKPMELVIALIQQLIKNSSIDTNRIYITGLSMGGYGTFDAIERYPHLFAAAVPVCGGGDVSKASSIAHIPAWIFHGAEDAAVNPQLSIDMAGALTKAGAHPGLTVYPGVGHFSWLGAYSDKLMMEWLFRQHK